jgi:hypothetical protein
MIEGFEDCEITLAINDYRVRVTDDRVVPAIAQALSRTFHGRGDVANVSVGAEVCG